VKLSTLAGSASIGLRRERFQPSPRPSLPTQARRFHGRPDRAVAESRRSAQDLASREVRSASPTNGPATRRRVLQGAREPELSSYDGAFVRRSRSGRAAARSGRRLAGAPPKPRDGRGRAQSERPPGKGSADASAGAGLLLPVATQEQRAARWSSMESGRRRPGSCLFGMPG